MSHYPIVILQAKNSSQLSNLILKCKEEGVLSNFFTTTMLSHSAEQQIADTANTLTNSWISWRWRSMATPNSLSR